VGALAVRRALGWRRVGEPGRRARDDRDAVARSRLLKPSIRRIGRDGIPIRHEIELELRLG
jgi:hypothetical protein